jgi:hypothetical protein
MLLRRNAISFRSVVASGAFCLVAALACSGCYKHVVGVSGPGSEAYDVYEPNRQEPEDVGPAPNKTAPNKVAPSKQAKE